MTSPIAKPLPTLVQGFFAEHLIAERQLSSCTVASYRDSLRLLLVYVHKQTRREPTSA
jgi:integrase/recombinase XerD